MSEEKELTYEEKIQKAEDRKRGIIRDDIQSSRLTGTVREVVYNAANETTTANIIWKRDAGKKGFANEYLKIRFINIGGYWGIGERSRLRQLKTNARVKIEYHQETNISKDGTEKAYTLQIADKLTILSTREDFKKEQKKRKKDKEVIEKKPTKKFEFED